MKLENIKTQEELDKLIQDKADLSFKAGLEKGKSKDTTSSEELEKLQKQLKEKEEALKGVQNELKPFKEKAYLKSLTKELAETKKAKEGVDISNYNLKKFEGEEGKIDWDKFLEANQHLKTEQKEIKKDTTLDANGNVIVKTADEEAEEAIKDAKLLNV